MDLEKIIHKTLEDFKEEKLLEKIIRKRLESTLEEVVKDSLQSYSGFGRKLKDHIQKEMVVNLNNLTLPEFNTLLLNWVKEIVQGNVNEVAKAQIEKSLKKFLVPIEKKTWPLTDIIEKFKAGVNEDDQRHGSEISFHCEEASLSSTNAFHIYFDEEPDQEKYQCDHNIYIADGKLYSVRSGRGDILKSKFKEFYGFDSFLFQLYSADVTIVVDAEDVDTHFGDW